MRNVRGRGRGWALALVIASLTGGPALAQTAPVPAAERTIRVTGFGEVQMQPDEAQIAFAVETVALTAQEAGRENARLMDRVIGALVAAGVPRADLETRGYALHPEYAHEEGRREPRIRGYRASNQVVLRTRSLDRVGEFIDLALGAGANRMDGISFQLRDSAPAEAAALRNAVQRGRAAAQEIADALGVRLGPVLDASTTSDIIRPYPVMMDRAMRIEAAGAPAPPTPIQPGEQTVRAQITLIYSIAGS